jgi:hypothetical protein
MVVQAMYAKEEQFSHEVADVGRSGLNNTVR